MKKTSIKASVLFKLFVTIIFIFMACSDKGNNISDPGNGENDSTKLFAFPGAQGFGKNASGGRGGQVLYVTNLNNNGTGSLRWACEDVTGPRMVLFKTGGIIQLNDDIDIHDGNLTIAGQSAPGDGITLKGAGIAVRDNNVIIRGLRIRPGDGPGQTPADTRRCISILNNSKTVSNIVIDHNSLTWAVDENITTWYFAENITISNNIIAECLMYSIHPKTISNNSPHSMGSLLGPDTRNITLYRNLFAHNWRRNPRITAEQVEVINNYMYNFDSGALITTSTHVTHDVTSSHFFNNYFDAQRVNTGNPPVGKQEKGPLYINGNLSLQIRPDYNSDEMRMVSDESEIVSEPIFSSFTDTDVIIPATDVLQSIKDDVGARWPDRDPVDTRIVNDAVNRLNQGRDAMKNSPREAGGYPAVNRGGAPADTDNDGIPDKYEEQLGCDPEVADSQKPNEDGYTMLEVYLNDIISGGV